MTDGSGTPSGGRRPRRPRESYTERRARRAEIDDPELVLGAALRYLETRARSVAETRRRLTDAGYRPELVEAAIDRLLALGILDDDAFARQWVESRDRARPRGEIALKRELWQRGIAQPVIEAVLDERRTGNVEDGPSGSSQEIAGSERVAPDEAAALRLLERRRRELERVTDPRKRRARAYALLARNGFDSEISCRLSAALVAPDD